MTDYAAWFLAAIDAKACPFSPVLRSMLSLQLVAAEYFVGFCIPLELLSHWSMRKCPSQTTRNKVIMALLAAEWGINQK
jgi:hypothetical protein